MAAKTRAILLAVVLLSAGLAGCADTDDTGTDDTTDDRDTDTGDRDTGDTGDRDTRGNQTGDNQTQEQGFERTFQDSIDEQNYMRNWTVPANQSGSQVMMEANMQGDAVDDFEATLFTPDGEEICTVSDGQDTQDTIGTGDDNQTDGENQCDEELDDTGEHRLTVWGNSTAEEAEYTINVTVQSSDGGGQTTGDDANGGGGGGIYGPVQSVTRA